jgi:hypothetical protein
VFNAAGPDKVHVTDDGFALAQGSARVGRDQFTAKVPPGLPMDVIADALSYAAAEDGSLLNFDVRAFYDEHVTAAMWLDPDGPQLRYDSFTSMTLVEAFTWLRERGFLAHRGNGDSYDYWLAAPAG